MKVNAHTHLELSDRTNLFKSSSIEFTDFIRKIVKSNNSCNEDSYKKACELGVQMLKENGTTWVADITKTGKSVKPLVENGIEGIVYVQFLGEDYDYALSRLEKAKAQINKLKKEASGSKIEIGLSVHAPYSVNARMWQPVIKYCQEENMPVCIHVAESPTELELFTKGTGNLRKLEEDFSLPTLPCPGITPIAYLNNVGFLDLKPTLVHVVNVTDADINLIKEKNCSVVHCPRSNMRLRCGRMPLEKFLAKGIRVSLGTDSLASSPSLDILEEANAAVEIHKGRVNKNDIIKLIGRRP